MFTVLLISTIALYFIESYNDPNLDIGEFFWTTIITIIGVADFAEKHPVTLLGKIIIFILSLYGIGIVGWIVAELAGNYVLNAIKRLSSMKEK